MKKILLGLILLVSFPTLSQSDSIDFSMAFVTNPVFTVGLDEVSQQEPVFQVSVSLNNLNTDSLGILTLVIYDLETSSLVANMALNQEQILSGTYTYNGLIVFNFPYLIPSGSYKVILDIQNYREAYLPRIEKNFLTN